MTVRTGNRWLVAAAGLTAVVSVLVLLLPLSSTQVSGGSVEYRSLLESQGAGIVLTLAVPVLLAAVPVLVPRAHRRVAAWVCTALLAAGAVLGLLTIGIFFVPSVVLLAVGAARSRPAENDGARPA